MYRDHKKDILLGSKTIKLLSNSKVLVVGAGRAAEIKLTTLCKKGFEIVVVASDFSEPVVELSKKFKNIRLEKRTFKSSDIGLAHLIVVATDNQDVNMEIARLCRRQKKLYSYLPDFKLGNVSFPYERETGETSYSISTKRGSPMTASYLGKKIGHLLREYDSFVAYICDTRESITDSGLKREIMEFMNSDEFYEFYRMGYGDLILKVFYGGEAFEKDSSD